jgi:Fic family protein
MQVDVRALARAEISSDIGQKASPTALEVLANIDAMQLAIENATTVGSVGVDQLMDIHRVLLEHASNSGIAGRIRTEQNWIGGNDFNPCGADFVPPPPEYLDALLGDLCRFCTDERLPPLVQAAISHAQFETIHPFVDGNGRTGRALVQIVLRRRSLAPAYVPPISVILATNRERYISGLVAYREGRLEEWLELFAIAASRAARLASRYLREVKELQEQWRSMVRASARIRADAAAWRLIDVLPAQPVVTLSTAVARTERTKPAANQAIEQLVAAGVLIPLSESRRNRAWEAEGLLGLLARLESGEAPEDQPELGVIPDISESEHGAPAREIIFVGPDVEHLMTSLPSTDPIYRLAPGAWLVNPGEQPEITLRVAVAMPNVLPLGGSGSTQLVTRMRGQRREELLIGLLDSSPITAWLRSIRSIWHWQNDAEWTLAGSGSPEFTELWFAPFGLENRRPALSARCGFATGVVDAEDATSVPALEAAIDVMLNIRELGADRRPAEVRHATDGPPAPGALALAEVAEALGHLFGFVEIATAAAESLLPAPLPRTARVGTWVSVSGGLGDRVLDLRTFRRIPRSTGLSQTADAFRFELAEGTRLSEEDVGVFVANLLYEGLERGGYRDLDAAINELRSGAVHSHEDH